MPSRTPKWGNALKAEFRQHIEQRRINPNKTDRDYILKIRDKYYPGRSDKTFIANYNSSVAEWRNGFYVNEYNKNKKKCESYFSSFILFVNKTHSSSASETPAAEEADYNSAEDDDYVGTEEGEEVSLGSEDTDIDEDELQDLEEDAAANNMPTPKKKATTPASNKKKAVPAVDDVIADFTKLSTISTKPDFSYHCPVFGYHFKEGQKHVIYFDVHYPSCPKDNLKYLKVLPGGRQVAFLVACSKKHTKEKVLKAQMGREYDPASARAEARAMQITHYVNTKYPARENSVAGDPQIVDLPFKCVEGNLEAHWCLDAEGMDAVMGKRFHHQQFSILMHFKVVSVENYTEEYKDADKVMFTSDFEEHDVGGGRNMESEDEY